MNVLVVLLEVKMLSKEKIYKKQWLYLNLMELEYPFDLNDKNLLII